MKRLRELGSVKHVSRSGMVVVATSPRNLPKIGADVVTRKMEKIGFVYDIIGPVSSPFILVKPKRADKLMFEDLFVVIEDAGSRKSKGKGNRKGEGNRKKGDRKRRRH
jgi:RNA-binding protein